MKNVLSVTLGTLLLAIAGFASTDPGAPRPAPDAPPAVEDRAENDLDTTPLVATLQTALQAKQCETRAATTASDDLDDACGECQLACLTEWRRCRRNCGTEDWYDCHDGCVDDLIWCQNTGCADVCDSSGRLGK